MQSPAPRRELPFGSCKTYPASALPYNLALSKILTRSCSEDAETGSAPLSSMASAVATEKGEMIWPAPSAGLACK